MSTFAVVDVNAITGITGPICSERAETSSPASERIRITNANGWTITASPSASVLPLSALIVMSEPAHSSPAAIASASPLAPRAATSPTPPRVASPTTSASATPS